MFQGFQDLIPKLANQLNLGRQLEASHICAIARKVLASDFPELTEYITIVSYDATSKVLRVNGLNNTALNEFHYIKAGFLATINQQSPANSQVKEIQLLIAKTED
jgi:hypothetical protein